MSTGFKVTPRAGYVHVELAPGYEITPDGSTALITAISGACMAQKQRRVLVEGSIAARRMGTMDAFDSGSLAAAKLTAVSLALLFYDYQPDQQSQFFKDVAQNRGARVEFFSERAEALRWLGLDSQP